MIVVVGKTQSCCDDVAVSDRLCRRLPVSILSDVSVSPRSSRLHHPCPTPSVAPCL
ncbi:hypothetical protein A2U01_0112253, partial [Trifolium medium]|nr:hypothetical protein [Trifolium medium]